VRTHIQDRAAVVKRAHEDGQAQTAAVVMSEAVKAAIGGPQPRFVAVKSECREPAKLFDCALSDKEGEVSVLYGY
jgi:hypothetical protein